MPKKKSISKVKKKTPKKILKLPQKNMKVDNGLVCLIDYNTTYSIK